MPEHVDASTQALVKALSFGFGAIGSIWALTAVFSLEVALTIIVAVIAACIAYLVYKYNRGLEEKLERLNRKIDPVVTEETEEVEKNAMSDGGYWIKISELHVDKEEISGIPSFAALAAGGALGAAFGGPTGAAIGGLLGALVGGGAEYRNFKESHKEQLKEVAILAVSRRTGRQPSQFVVEEVEDVTASEDGEEFWQFTV